MESSRPRILIVDDEASIREALSRWFTMRDFHVAVAASGPAAQALCREQTFDVMTMDLEMPEMSGFDTIAALREQGVASPIVVLTGYPKNADYAFELGAARVLTKPIRLRELEAEVRAVMDGVAGERG